MIVKFEYLMYGLLHCLVLAKLQYNAQELLSKQNNRKILLRKWFCRDLCKFKAT